jgi:hypothetical protein
MKPISYCLTFFILGVLLSSGCSTFELPQEQGAILFQDNFSSSNSGWVRFHDNTYSTDYSSGVYRINIEQTNFEAWAVPGLEFSNVLVDVEAKLVSGPENNVYGVICRYNKPNNFYFFLISSDGFAGIGVYLDGERTLLTGDNMLPAEAILMGDEVNALRVECVGEQLKLIVNDVVVNEVQSSALQSGDVGLIAGTYDLAGVLIEFDDFKVTNP